MRGYNDGTDHDRHLQPSTFNLAQRVYLFQHLHRFHHRLPFLTAEQQFEPSLILVLDTDIETKTHPSLVPESA